MRYAFGAVAVLLFCSLLATADVGDAGVTGVLTKPPALLKQVEARFPPQALDAGVAGRVEMEIDLGPDGKVMDARVVQSAGWGFDEAALEAVRQFEFSPAEVDGRPAAVRIRYTYEFLLRRQVVERPVEKEVVNFSGQLLERGTREPLANASVVVVAGEAVLEATSDLHGRFEMKNVPPGTHRVVVTSTEHARYEVTEEFREGQRTEVVYYVRRRTYGAYETVVRARREKKEVAQISLKQEEIRLIPGTQGDALKVVQNLPGVARAPFSIGLLIVRGGKPWDTRVHVDDVLVPQLFHFGGLYATFNSNLLEEISFHPGNFSAEYGRNIGGLVNAWTRTPAREGYHGYVDLNLIDSSALVEGPLGGDWTFAASGRRSYIDFTLPLAVKTFFPEANALLFTVAPRYYDYQLKLEKREKGRFDRFWVSLFGSNDQVAFVLPNPAYDPEGRSSFDTLLAYNRLAFGYQRQLTENLKLLSHNHIGFDHFEFSGGTDLFFRSTLFPMMGRELLRLDVPEQRLKLTVGADLYAVPFTYSAQGPPRFKLNQIPDPFISRRLIREAKAQVLFEPGAFAEVVWNPYEPLKLVAGLRADYDTLMRDAWIDPRASAFFSVSPRTTLKAAAGIFHQPPDYRQGLLSPTFGNPELLPEGATHYSVGIEHQLTETVGLDVQLYYKDLWQQAQPTLALSPDEEVDLHYISTGRGRSFGAEILLRHQLTDRFFGWLAYSLSKSERRYPGETEYGLHPLDQPHNLIAVASYKLPGDWVVGGRLRYASGALHTPYVGAVYDANGNYYYPLIGKLFSERLPSFFALDVRIDKRFVHERWMLSLYADVQNVTNHGNVEGLIYNYDYTQKRFVYGLPILPSLGVRGEF